MCTGFWLGIEKNSAQWEWTRDSSPYPGALGSNGLKTTDNYFGVPVSQADGTKLDIIHSDDFAYDEMKPILCQII